MNKAQRLDKIVAPIGDTFGTFGGGQCSNFNQLVNALKDQPLQFAADVDVKTVVRFVLNAETRLKK